MATVEVLGEGIRTKVPIPGQGGTVGDLLRAAGVTVRESGWELFVDGVRRPASHPLNGQNGEQDLTVSYSPRTRGA